MPGVGKRALLRRMNLDRRACQEVAERKELGVKEYDQDGKLE